MEYQSNLCRNTTLINERDRFTTQLTFYLDKKMAIYYLSATFRRYWEFTFKENLYRHIMIQQKKKKNSIFAVWPLYQKLENARWGY